MAWLLEKLLRCAACPFPADAFTAMHAAGFLHSLQYGKPSTLATVCIAKLAGHL